jgi:spermidine synthase
METSRNIYPVVEYAWAAVPTYPSGQIGFILCSKDTRVDFKNPVSCFSDNMKYYTPEVHKAAFCLPKFAKDYLYPNNQ